MKSYIRKINLCFKIIIISIGVILSILYLIPGGQFPKIWSYAATIGLAFAPEIWRYLFRLKISEETELLYYIFLVPAMILGIDFDLYKVWAPLDKVAHCFSGMLAAVAAREILMQAFEKKKMPEIWFKILFMVCFAAFTAAVWECFEFSCDKIAGMHMQELISEGVDDTMYDIIFALIGAIVTSAAFTAVELGTAKAEVKKKKK